VILVLCARISFATQLANETSKIANLIMIEDPIFFDATPLEWQYSSY